MMPPKKAGVVVAIGLKPKSPGDYGSTMSDEDNPDAEQDAQGDNGPDGDNDEDDQNDEGEPEINLPPGYTPPDDAKLGEEIPFLGKLKVNPDGKTATLCSIDGASYSGNDEEDNTESDNSEMQLDNQTPSPDDEPSPPEEDMDNSHGAMAGRLAKLRMKLKAKM